MRGRVWGQLLGDCALILAASVLALAQRHDFALTLARLTAAAPYLLLSLLTAVISLVALGIHRSIWRHSDARDYERIAMAALATVIGAVALGFVVNRL
ncbi:MAG: hypothetical protein R3D67_11915 [Hyphomicrobiaceae bacterium]